MSFLYNYKHNKLCDKDKIQPVSPGTTHCKTSEIKVYLEGLTTTSHLHSHVRGLRRDTEDADTPRKRLLKQLQQQWQL